MWVEMDVLWGNCSVLCRMYELVKKWNGSDYDNRGYQGRRGLDFKLAIFEGEDDVRISLTHHHHISLRVGKILESVFYFSVVMPPHS